MDDNNNILAAVDKELKEIDHLLGLAQGETVRKSLILAKEHLLKQKQHNVLEDLNSEKKKHPLAIKTIKKKTLLLLMNLVQHRGSNYFYQP